MKKCFIVLCLLIVSGCGQTGKYGYDPFADQKKITQATLKLTLIPQDTLAPGKSTLVMAKLNSLTDQFLLTDADLETVHTQKFHLLVVDPTLTDYQHVHPQPTTTPGLYSFSFIPKFASYRAWADVTPITTHKQEFVRADLGDPRGIAINQAETHQASVGGYTFTLSFDTPPTKDKPSMGTITITDSKGKAVTALEPVMGTSGHIVGFYDDFRTVVHTHPMEHEHYHGGGQLMFHLEPAKVGFIKLFAQVKIGGKDIYAPFGVVVR